MLDSLIKERGLDKLGRGSICRETVFRSQTWGAGNYGGYFLHTMAMLALGSPRKSFDIPSSLRTWVP